MAYWIAASNANWTGGSSWKMFDSTSAQDLWGAGQSALLVPTSIGAGSDSSTWTGDSATIDGIAINLASRAVSPTGTITVRLHNVTDNTDLALISIGVTDLPNLEFAALGYPLTVNGHTTGSWHTFVFGSVTMNPAKTYCIRITTSNANQVWLLGGSPNNWNRILRTTTTGEPGIGDTTFIGQEYTGAGTHTNRQIVMNVNTTSAFGPIYISQGGKLLTATSTNTELRTLGDCYIFVGGEYDVGTSGARINSANTAFVTMSNPSTDGYTGWNLCGGTWRMYGDNGRIRKTYLYADEVAGATYFQATDSVAGWNVSDVLIFGSTSQDPSQWDIAECSGASGVNFGTSAGLLYDHAGVFPSDPFACPVINVTSNVICSGVTHSGYITVYCGTVDFNNVEFQQLGCVTDYKSGLVFWNQFSTNTSAAIIDCAFHNPGVTTLNALRLDQYYASFVVSGCVFGDLQDAGTGFLVNINSASDESTVIQNISIIGNGSVAFPNNGIDILNDNLTITNLLVSSISGMGINWQPHDIGGAEALSNWTVFSCGTNDNSFVADSNYLPTSEEMSISGLNLYRNLGNPQVTGVFDYEHTFTFDNVSSLGNQFIGLDFNATLIASSITISNSQFDSDFVYGQQGGLGIRQSGTVCPNMVIINTKFGETYGHSGGDIYIGGNLDTNGIYLKLPLYNCLLASSTPVYLDYKTPPTRANFEIRSSRDAQTADNYKSFFTVGKISRDDSIVYNTFPTERLTRTTTSVNYDSESSTKTVNVRPGNVAKVTISVQKDPAYNGSNPRLICKDNQALGVPETVLYTFSGVAGSFEDVTVTLPSVLEKGTLRLIIDYDGTAGFVNVSNWTATIF